MLNKWLKPIFGCLGLLFLLNFSPVKGQTADCKSIDFNLAREFETGRNAYFFTSADLNGDGNVDVITPVYDTETVSVIYGDGAGGFAPPQTFPTMINVTTVTTGDLNGDGKLDLVGANYSLNNKFTVLLNNGQNGFSSPILTNLPTGVYGFYNLKVGDFNGDGKADVAGLSLTNLYFFFGNGQGSVTLNNTLPWEASSSEMVVGNFNNDNLTDLAVTLGDRSYPWEFGVVLGNLSGGLVFNNRFTLGNEPSDITIGDFNGDNLTDIAVGANYPFSNSTPKTFFLQPWFGNGNGNFTEGAKINLPFMVSGVTAGDFNGDGKIDLAGSLGSLTAAVYGIGNGTFQNLTYWTTPPSDRIIAADVNRDGKKDLLTVRAGSLNSFVSVLLSSGSGFLAPKPTLYGATDIVAGDFNGDGLPDMVTGTDSDFPSPSEVVIALNNGNGGLLPDRNFETAIAYDSLTIGDFNGDGKKDVITGHDYNGKLYSAYLGDGTGNLAVPISQQLSRGVREVVAGDFNNDGKDDVLVVDDQRGYPRLSNGNGTFSPVPDFYFEPINPTVTPRKGDFNHDGKLDFVISDGVTVKIWLGVGNGTFTVSDSKPLNASRITVGDLNGDGNLDVSGIKTSGIETILTGILTNANGTFGDTFSKTIPGVSSSIISGDFNSDGYADVAFEAFYSPGNLVVLPSTGQSPFFGTPIFYSVGDVVSPPYQGYSDRMIAADYNADGRIDIGYAGSRSRGVIYNTSDQRPCVSINDVTVTEGDNGNSNAVFTVALSAASMQTVRVNYSLAGESAILGTDLENVSGRLEIPAGQTSATINIPVKGDLLDEFDETFLVNLTSPVNASLAKAVGTGTILDNDAEPSLTITDVSLVEPISSQGTVFRVTLSAPSGKPISFRYATANGTAISGSDYFPVNTVVNVQTGAVTVDCYVTVIGDTTFEPDENFFLNITNASNVSLADAQGEGRIINNDPVPTLNIYSNSVFEGDSGTSNTELTVQLSNPSYLPITFNALTSSGTATAGSDYVASDTVVTIPAEQQTATTNVQIIGDTINEPGETFFVNLYNVSNAVISNPQAQYFIIDDENVSNDFDRDGKTDFAVFRPSNGTWYSLFSSTGGFSGTRFGLGTDTPVSGDYNGDGRTDIAVWRPSNGTWYTPIANRTQQWGTDGDIPVQGDYDNDGRIDVAVFRPNTGYWYIRQSSDNAARYVAFGANNDIPVPADYDGDGKTDIAVFRPSNNTWYVIKSSDNANYAVQFGTASDKLVPADYDGDGKADIAVFREGIWYLLRSSAGNAFSFFQWGQSGDKPVPGNYDGDDKTDFAVYRSGVWYIYQSSNQTVLSKQFGADDDIPIPFVSNN
jgi:FG-GAP-like repeat/Calx-beta domain